MMKSRLILIAGLFLLAVYSCNDNALKMEKKFNDLVAHHDSVIVPLSKDISLSYWNASISGKEEDYEKYEQLSKQIVQFYSNKDLFKQLESIKASGAIKDSIQARQLDLLYLSFLSNQADPALLNEIIEMETNIEKKYSNFRAEVGLKKISDNEVEKILGTSTNSVELQEAWEAHKRIGTIVADDIVKLVKKRNQLAKDLGFGNYHEMSLKLSDQNPFEIEKMFDELDALTRKTFLILKSEVDSFLAKRNHIEIAELQPWHYQNRFFQEAPKIYPVDLDKYYEKKNLEKLTSEYFAGIGLPINDMLEKSDLYEKEGKNQHAYCIDIDNEGDVRVLCNIKPNLQWMNTMLHEFGHAVYDKNIDRSLPFILRDPAHTFTTEAIAMLFGRMATNPQWIQDMVKISDTEKQKIAENSFKTLRLEQLVFSRWAQVMYRFEKSLYENPEQDLNALWWQMVEKYQMIKKPQDRNQPDWASKIHIATSPCYYHNYLLGELLASQLNHYICYNVINDTANTNQVSYTNRTEVGEFLSKKVFMPGSKLYWNQMIEEATGEKLTAKYYAKQFVE